MHRADPPHIFWDENYHVTSAERYLEGVAQFEPHPPLGLMLIAAGEAWDGKKMGDFDWYVAGVVGKAK